MSVELELSGQAPAGVSLRLLSPREVGERSDELLALLADALASSPIAASAESQLELAHVELRRCVDYPDRYSVITAEAPTGETAGFALVSEGAGRGRLPRELEAARPGWASDAAVLVWLAVLPDKRRNGIGAALHNAALARFESTRAYLYAEPENTPALVMYAHLGWFELGKHRRSLLLGWERPMLADTGDG